MVPGPAVSVSPGNLLEMMILQPHPTPTDSETHGGGALQTVVEHDLQVIPMHAKA